MPPAQANPSQAWRLRVALSLSELGGKGKGENVPIKGSFPDSPLPSAFPWPRETSPPLASMAWSPHWHAALPPAGGDREWRPPQTLKPVPAGPGPVLIPLSPLGISLPLPGPLWDWLWDT